jgi:hypothetical protein
VFDVLASVALRFRIVRTSEAGIEQSLSEQRRFQGMDGTSPAWVGSMVVGLCMDHGEKPVPVMNESE